MPTPDDSAAYEQAKRNAAALPVQVGVRATVEAFMHLDQNVMA